MNRYQLIRGFNTHWEALDYATRLPDCAVAKVAPYRYDRERWKFAVDVSRDYTGGRL